MQIGKLIGVIVAVALCVAGMLFCYQGVSHVVKVYRFGSQALTFIGENPESFTAWKADGAFLRSTRARAEAQAKQQQAQAKPAPPVVPPVPAPVEKP